MEQRGGLPPAIGTQRGFVTALVLPQGNAADSPHLVPMVKEQISNTGVIPSMVSADDGYSSQQGLEEVLGLGVKVVSISGAKGKKIIEAQQWKSQPYRQARAERSAIESLVFTLNSERWCGAPMRTCWPRCWRKCSPTMSLRSSECEKSFQSSNRWSGQRPN